MVAVAVVNVLHQMLFGGTLCNLLATVLKTNETGNSQRFKCQRAVQDTCFV